MGLPDEDRGADELPPRAEGDPYVVTPPLPPVLIGVERAPPRPPQVVVAHEDDAPPVLG